MIHRLLWTPVHLAWSLAALLVLALGRRGRSLVFSHYHDVDGSGRDRQMGPLVDALAAADDLVEVTRVPLSGALWTNFQLKRRLFLSQALLLFPGWLLGFGHRPRVTQLRQAAAGVVLALLRPRVVYLIDESGSGQPLLRAARRRGVPVVGIQHGDFAGNPQDAPPPGAGIVEPADVLCVWSPWFRDRLLASSPIYDAGRVVVTGRQRYPQATPSATRPGATFRVLVIGESAAAFWREIDPFIAALNRTPDMHIRVRSHPAAVRDPATTTPLDVELHDCDAVVGRGSSALLEAIYWQRPVVIAGADPRGLAAAGLATICSAPSALPDLVRELVAGTASHDPARAHATVWGGAEDAAVGAILAAAAKLV